MRRGRSTGKPKRKAPSKRPRKAAAPTRSSPASSKFPAVNGSQFAKLLGCSVETISNMVDAGMPCERGARAGAAMVIRLEDALPFVFARRDERKGSQRDRLMIAQADKFEIENARRRGELLVAADVAAQDQAIAADFAGRLDGIPGRLANELAGVSDPAEIRRRLLEELRGVRDAFADAIAKQADTPSGPDDDGPDHEAAPSQDRGSVGGPDEDSAGRLS